ncbi:PorV/PorQ family protein [candidate division KSB1 bacterium]|nr:PorV/PorQ family protein [candidate division KSB1 bacterium]
MKRFVFLLFFITIALPSFGQNVSKVGTTAARFLNIDVGARAVGMGGAYTTMANDVSAIYWNPAGLVRFSESQVLFNHISWIADISYDFAGIAIPLQQWGTLGFGAFFLTMDEMEVTTVDQPMGTGEMFDAGSYTFSASYAKALTDRFSIGGNFKYIYENIRNCSATGIAFDIGTQYETQFNGLMIGMSITNYGTKMQMTGRDMQIQADINQRLHGNNENINANLETDQFDLPLLLRVGVGMNVLQASETNDLLLAVDAMHPNDDTQSLNLGAEYAFKKTFFLRAGYKSLLARDSQIGLSMGAGFLLKIPGFSSLCIDYAYQDFGVLTNIQMFSIGLGF